jgi:WD40 repeat protein
MLLGDVYSIAWNKTKPSVIATGGGDDVGMIWDLAAQTYDPIHILKGHTDSVCQVSFSTDGKYLATCGLDAVLKIWDTDTGALLHSLEGPTESVEVLLLSPPLYE